MRVRGILLNREVRVGALMSTDFLALPAVTTVGETLATIRTSGCEPGGLSYIFVLHADRETLAGVVDLRHLVLAPDTAVLGDIMVAPVVSVSGEETREDLVELFARYHFRMLPVVDADDRILGVIRYHDIMKGVFARTRA